MNAGLDMKISFYLLFLSRQSHIKMPRGGRGQGNYHRHPYYDRREKRGQDSDRDRDRDIKDRDLSGEGYKEFLNWSETKDGK